MSTTFPKSDIQIISLLSLLLSFITTSETVEFSQFYLPPCCHFAAHPPTAAIVASSPSEQNGTYSNEPAHPRFTTSGEELVDGEDSNSVYKLIVPLKFPSPKAAITALSVAPAEDQPHDADGVEAAPPTQHHLGSEATTVLPFLSTQASSSSTAVGGTTTIQAAKDIVKDASSDNVFNVFLYKELEKMRLSRGQHPLPPMNSPPARPETVFDKIAKLGYTMSERLHQLSSTFQSIAAPPPSGGGIAGLLGNSFQQNSHGPYQMYKTYVKRQASHSPDQFNNEPMKMPAVWIKNLRKALYQSLTKRRNGGKLAGSVQDSPNPIDTDSKLLWKNLRRAKLKFIDLASQSTSDLPDEIYLPSGQGPIVSGIATLAGASGNWEIRIPSELYTPTSTGSDNQGAGSGEGATDLCKCSLVHDGDMILAYWSISRIITDDGQPALQYLVYPHPYPHHTIHLPTPPQLIPFSDGNPDEFRPSLPDPLPNYFNEISKNVNHHKVPIVTDARHRGPKLYHEHHHQHHVHGTFPENPIPPAPGIPHSGGVPIVQDGKYTDDFLSLYRDAINHHFHNIDSMKTMMIANDDDNIEGFINQNFPPQPPHPPASLTPPQQPHHLPDIPYGGGYLEGPPTSIPGIVTPVDPALHFNDHPKSIQDILSPFVPPPPPPQQLPPPRNNLPPNQNQRPPFYNPNPNNNVNVDDGLYYNDGRKYQNPNIPPPPYNSNRPLPPQTGQGQQTPPNYRPPLSQNGVSYDDYYNSGPAKPYYPTGQYDKRQPERDLPKKQAYIKEYFYNNKSGGKNSNFAQRIGIRGLGGSLNDIDNPDGYILDFKK